MASSLAERHQSRSATSRSSPSSETPDFGVVGGLGFEVAAPLSRAWMPEGHLATRRCTQSATTDGQDHKQSCTSAGRSPPMAARERPGWFPNQRMRDAPPGAIAEARSMLRPSSQRSSRAASAASPGTPSHLRMAGCSPCIRGLSGTTRGADKRRDQP
jgi:hypothetical protein